MTLLDDKFGRETIVMDYDLDGIERNEYNGHESIGREEVLSSVKKLKRGNLLV